MTPGTITIDDNTGAESGSGLALALYNAISAIEQAANPFPDPATPDADWEDTVAAWTQLVQPMIVKVKKSWAREAQRHANVLGQPVVQSMTATGDISLDTDLVVCPARGAATVLTLPAGATIGHTVDVYETSNSVVNALSVAAPGGEAVAGLTTFTARVHRRYVKHDATNWLGVA